MRQFIPIVMLGRVVWNLPDRFTIARNVGKRVGVLPD